MNLATDNWIPIVWHDRRSGKVSLIEAFKRGHEIADLAVRPHERIALMRLLICVAQAALDGPKDRWEWQECAKRLPAAVEAYLTKWNHAFELFGDGQRFLQIPGLSVSKSKVDDEGNSVSKLDLSLATGNNSTLFDNAGGVKRDFENERVALMLLTYQCFSPSGLIADVEWSGHAMGRSSNHSPCVIKSLTHAYLKADSLTESIRLNILPRDELEKRKVPWGQPLWESIPKSMADTGAVDNALHTYLGRMLPLSRLSVA